MFEKYRVGIMGSGNIAGIMAETIKRMKNVKEFHLGEFGEGDAGVTIVTFE